jgi:hypothetical protein
MTVFGKLLVFMNLVFSVVTGALIVFVFTTRANWQASFEDAKSNAEKAEVAYKKEKNSHENDLKQKDESISSLKQETDRLQTQITGLQAENADIKVAAAKQDNTNKSSTTQQQKLEAELEQINKEREQIIKEMGDLRVKIVAMQKEIDTKHRIAIDADLEAKNLKQRNANLLREYEILTVRVRELESMSTLPGTGGGTPGAGNSIIDQAPRAAPLNVRGKITGVGATGTSLAQVNIGSDSGLNPGTVLTVYKGSEYKGDLVLTTVQPKTAVGKFIAKNKTSKIEKDDDVITSFGSSPQ